MYLKSIKAHGFKSFADKITIDLNQNITGIVGPNGSGKSNVVDAVRWVLGEQSVKSLRGDGTMTDVIFSGSKSRNAQNVASVTLVFDNKDHYLPLDYEEISIKRRVYKDGTNEYFLNEEKVRLKDITDLFLDSGIAKESFNIISQGKIEEILSNKPTDRRIIFEEAAGVLKYKKRKEDALRKLEKTHDNMNRVNDIIEELGVQVEPLKEQKEKALIYLQNQEELQSIEVALITNDITSLNYSYQDKKGKIEALNQEILSLSASNSTQEAKIEEYKLSIQKTETALTECQKQLLEATSNVEKINSQKVILLEREKYAVEDQRLRDNILHLKEQQLELETSLHHLRLEKETILKNKQEIQFKIEELTHLLEVSKEKKAKQEIELANESRKNSYLKNSIDQLENSIETNSNIPLAVKKVLDNPKLKGVHDIIGNVLDVENEYATAISTALGMNSSNLIVDNELVAKDAISYLKSLSVGRATFFPLNIIKPKGMSEGVLGQLKQATGFINIASNLVKYEEIYRNIILNQLGNIVVVDTIDHANQISKQLQYNYRVVTLDGEILHVGGSLTGGTNKNRSIISDKYDLQMKKKEYETSNEFISKFEEEIQEKDSELRILEDKIYLANKDRIELDTVLEQKAQVISNTTLKKTDIENEIQGTGNVMNHTLKQEEEDIMKAYYEAIQKKDEIAHQHDNLMKEKQNLNDALSEYDFSLKRENSLFHTKNKELTTLEIEVNRQDVKLDNLLHTLNEEYSMTYEYASSHYHLEMEESLARTKVNSLKRTMKELGVVNLAAPEEYDRVSVRYEFLIKQREDLVQAENTLLEIITEMDHVMEREFMSTFKVVQSNFSQTFKELFKGGNAELKLTNPENILETGIEIIASPPGKKLTSISLLSGGEKTFTAISLLFAILKSRPMPFCILDEVEAALDEVNVGSFGEYLVGLKSRTQFILITHKKKTMEFADTLYGITMQESGVSKLVSVKLEEVK